MLHPLTSNYPDVSGAWTNLGVAYSLGGDHSSAVECLQRAVRLDPNNGVARFQLGRILMEDFGEVEQALQCFELALDQATDIEPMDAPQLACLMLLNRLEPAAGIVTGLSEAFGDEAADKTADEALAIAQRILRAGKNGEFPRTSRALGNPEISHAGSRIIVTFHYDNSANNPANPDASKPVRWGDRSEDEMMVTWTEALDALPAASLRAMR